MVKYNFSKIYSNSNLTNYSSLTLIKYPYPYLFIHAYYLLRENHIVMDPIGLLLASYGNQNL